MLRISLIVLSCCLLAVLASTPKERLFRDLLDDYEASVDPGNIALKTNVKLIYASWDPRTRVVTNEVWEYHAWKDARLKWTPSEHGGIESLRVPSKLVWTPDTVQYNSLAATNDRDNCNVLIKSDGSVLWIPRAVYRIPCTGEKEITCVWRFGSWTYDGDNLILEAEGADPLDLSVFSSSSPLVVSSHKAEVVSHTYPCCEEPYPSLDVTIVFKPSTTAGTSSCGCPYSEHCTKSATAAP